ncbi:hypothetical protein E2C01_091691 [Portunus trituberculatus]|uniref:Uncharacterized protein n=1 Tax=Portunus trituberculatus TaxID=210409 RepID=A0A5B7JPS3_PORTR|nr:hypothetical protein [Portunus trituberculatus]
MKKHYSSHGITPRPSPCLHDTTIAAHDRRTHPRNESTEGSGPQGTQLYTDRPKGTKRSSRVSFFHIWESKEMEERRTSAAVCFLSTTMNSTSGLERLTQHPAMRRAASS